MGSLKRGMLGILLVVLAIPMAGIAFGDFREIEEYLVDEVTRFPWLVRGDLGEMPEGETVEAAMRFMEEVALEFGMVVGIDEIQPADNEPTPDSSYESQVDLMVHPVRLKRIHAGLPVEGADFLVHYDDWGIVRLVNGNLGGFIDIAPEPQIEPVEALEIIRAETEARAVALLKEPELLYVARFEQPTRLAWNLRVQLYDREGSDEMNFLVDAIDPRVIEGGLVAQTLNNSSNRRIARDSKNGYDKYNFTTLFDDDPGSSIPPPTNCPDKWPKACAAWDNVTATYEYFYDIFKRDSYDGKGGKIRLYVNYGKKYKNAFAHPDFPGALWFGNGDGIMFSPLGNARDIVAHEYTHCVTRMSANLNYQAEEPGALNEMMSDVFASAVMRRTCELAQAAGYYPHPLPYSWCLDNSYDLGEEVFTPNKLWDALRYMSDPTLDFGSISPGIGSHDWYPDRYTVAGKPPSMTYKDWMGVIVHYNCGIGNLAFYLVAEGGTHPRNKSSITVSGLGYKKAERIFYFALNRLMTSSTTFKQARSLTALSALFLYDPWYMGLLGCPSCVNSDNADVVHSAWKAVGVP